MIIYKLMEEIMIIGMLDINQHLINTIGELKRQQSHKLHK